jgi:hypothetical protein
MTVNYELRDPDEATHFLVQGLHLQRVRKPVAGQVRPVLRWALELVSSGQSLPPLGFVADLGHAALGADWEAGAGRDSALTPVLAPGLVRTYEDYVLGKFYADWTFARASDSLRRLQCKQVERDQARGLAFLLGAFRARADFGGVEMSPGIIKSLLEISPQEVLALGLQSLQRDGLHPILEELYLALIAAARRTAEVLAPEDLFELEHGTALAEFGERVALRQILQAATRLEATVPTQRICPREGRQDVPTRILDEDTYPVGGFSSLSTRGSIESLLHSQLAFMERAERPDLFDLKYLRDELLYYARDENQFLRRRRSFLFALYPDLVQTRRKDPSLPYQRGVLLLALILVVVRRLSDWLSTDALRFEFLFLSEQKKEPSDPLKRERELLQMLFRKQIVNETVAISSDITVDALATACALRGSRSLCHCLTLSSQDRDIEAQDTIVTRLVVDAATPSLRIRDEKPVLPPCEEPFETWAAALVNLLRLWI